MKALTASFKIFLVQISRDFMLYVICIVPLLVSFVFRFGVPYLDRLLSGYFQTATILSDYYLLFDLFLASITPMMFCFVSSLVILSEYDENITNYLAVTPIGKKGYLFSRLIIPAAISCAISFILVFFFSLTVWTPLMIFTVSALSGIASILFSLLIVSFSHNRVEGLAIGKFSTLLMLGLPVPFFLLSNVQYLFAFLPSFWIAKLRVENNYLFVFPAIAVSLIWIVLFYKRFERKLT